jgi:hypothetical protein
MHYLFITVVLPLSYLILSLCTCIGCEKLARSSPFSSQVALKQRRLLLSSSTVQNFYLFYIHTWHCCVTPIKSESGPELQPKQREMQSRGARWILNPHSPGCRWILNPFLPGGRWMRKLMRRCSFSKFSADTISPWPITLILHLKFSTKRGISKRPPHVLKLH